MDRTADLLACGTAVVRSYARRGVQSVRVDLARAQRTRGVLFVLVDS